MSGHNKWSQIKHKKAATDSMRSRLFSKYAKLIALESRLAAGNTLAPALVAAIERAKRDSMPKENIERAILKGAGVGTTDLQVVLFEAFGPGGVAILISAVTDNNNRTNQEVKHIFSLHGFPLGAPGSASWAFQKEGSMYIPRTITELTIRDTEKLSALMEALDNQADIQSIYTTAASTQSDLNDI